MVLLQISALLMINVCYVCAHSVPSPEKDILSYEEKKILLKAMIPAVLDEWHTNMHEGMTADQMLAEQKKEEDFIDAALNDVLSKTLQSFFKKYPKVLKSGETINCYINYKYYREHQEEERYPTDLWVGSVSGKAWVQYTDIADHITGDLVRIVAKLVNGGVYFKLMLIALLYKKIVVPPCNLSTLYPTLWPSSWVYTLSGIKRFM